MCGGIGGRAGGWPILCVEMSTSRKSLRAGEAQAEGAAGLVLLRWIVWTVSLAGWLFVVASLISFNAGDPPTHVVYPANESIANWCGPAGAAVAYYLARLLGAGAWVLMLGWAIHLVVTLSGRRVRFVVVRAVGLLMAAAGLGGFQAIVMPQSGLLSGLTGGLAGGVLSAELVTRFATFGSMLWLGLLIGIGLIVALDRWLWMGPMAIVRALSPAAQRAGSTTATTAKATGSLIGALATMVKNKAPVAIRLDDLEDDEDLKAVKKGKKTKKRVRIELEPIDEMAGGLGGGEAFDPGEEMKVQEDEVLECKVDEEEEDEDELPGAPQVFDKDALREKIAKLPVRFTNLDKQVATEDNLRDLQNVAELKGYKFPGLDLLEEPESNFSETLEAQVREQAEALEFALQQYRIEGEVVGIESGPVITLYHVRLAPGTKVAKLTAVANDIARSLKAVNLRIVSNMVGRDTVGVEVPNPTKEKVRLKELMSNTESFGKMKLPMFLGKDASGEPLIADLTKMPHMLIAGTTGSGKSVCMNTIIMSFLYTKKPNELKLVLVDPKMVEMSQFKSIPHLMCPVVTEMPKAAAILEWAMGKMDERYELLAEAGCRDIAGYNKLSWEELKERFEPASEAEEASIPRRLPYMVFIIDELADLMMTTKEVEASIIRIAQKARAVGIHLILATQRPQANVVTGLIKSNMPCRVAFKVASGMDSRIVLDQKGGELLLGQGDMLYLSPESHKLIRCQGTLVDDKEIRRVVRFVKDIAGPSFERQLIQLRSGDDDEERLIESENNSSASLAAAQEDPLFDRAVEIVLESKRGSVSLLQRRLAIGYTRASRLIDLMGIAGIIGEHKGSVARQVQITPEEWEAMKALAEEESQANQQGELFDGAEGNEAGEAVVEEGEGESPPWEEEDVTEEEGGDEDESEVIDEEEECEIEDEDDEAYEVEEADPEAEYEEDEYDEDGDEDEGEEEEFKELDEAEEESEDEELIDGDEAEPEDDSEFESGDDEPEIRTPGGSRANAH